MTEKDSGAKLTAAQKSSRRVWKFCAILSRYNGAIEHKGQIGAKSVKGRWQRANKSSEKRQREGERGGEGEGGGQGETMNGENSVKCKRNLGEDVCLSGRCVCKEGEGCR